MGYTTNPFYQLCRDTAAAGADGFIVVDLPLPE
jgi:tryptophan synthase alpha subunit